MSRTNRTSGGTQSDGMINQMIRLAKASKKRMKITMFMTLMFIGKIILLPICINPINNMLFLIHFYKFDALYLICQVFPLF